MLTRLCSWYAHAETARNVVIADVRFSNFDFFSVVMANAFEVQPLCSLGEFSDTFRSRACNCLPLATVTTNVLIQL
jgi:hypothetical protein